MVIRTITGIEVTGTDVRNINNREMQQMHELKNRIKDVLDSHKPEAKEKKYISDDDLTLAYAILAVFTQHYAPTQASEFDKFIAEYGTSTPLPESVPLDEED